MKCLQKIIGKDITAKYKLNTHHCKEQLKTFSHPTQVHAPFVALYIYIYMHSLWQYLTLYQTLCSKDCSNLPSPFVYSL